MNFYPPEAMPVSPDLWVKSNRPGSLGLFFNLSAGALGGLLANSSDTGAIPAFNRLYAKRFRRA